MLIANRAVALGGAVAAGYRYIPNIVREAMITIASGKVTASLTGFQVKIDLADLPSAFWNGIQSNGGNIRAYTSGGAELPIDIPFIDMASRAGWAFVRMDVPTTGVVFYLRTIDGAGAYADNATYGMAAVWNGLSVVYSGNSLKNRASGTGVVFSQMQAGVDFTSRPGWLTSAASGTTQGGIWCLGGKNVYGWTIRASTRCLFTQSGSTTSVCPIGHGQALNGTNPNYIHGDLLQYSTSYYLKGHYYYYNTTNATWLDSDIQSAANGYPSNVDCSVAWVVAQKAHLLFFDGAQIASATSANNTDNSGKEDAPTLSIGCNNTGEGRFPGSITDAYLALTNFGADRLKAEHDNWNWAKAGKGFYSIAA